MDPKPLTSEKRLRISFYDTTELPHKFQSDPKTRLSAVEALKKIAEEKGADFAVPVGSKLGFKAEIFTGSEKSTEKAHIILYEAKDGSEEMMLWSGEEEEALKITSGGEAEFKKKEAIIEDDVGSYIYEFAIGEKDERGVWRPSQTKEVRRVEVVRIGELELKLEEVLEKGQKTG